MGSTHQRLSYVIACLTVIVRLGFGQGEQADQNAPRVALNGVVELKQLVDLAAARLDLNIQYDARELEGSVTLRLGASVSDPELWSLTNHVLRARGFTTVRSRDGTFVAVTRAERAVDLGRLDDAESVGLRDAATDVPLLPGFLTVVVRVKHVSIQSALEALKPLLGAAPAQATALGPSGLALLTDARPRVERALEVLKMLDVPQDGMRVERVRVEHLPAAEAALAANEILRARDSAARTKVEGRSVAAPDGGAVLVIAPSGEQALWRTTLSELDRAPDQETRTYVPQHFPVAEVADLASRILEPGATEASGPARDKAASRGPRIVTDTLTGTLIVTGTTRDHERVEDLLSRLDGTPPESRRQARSYPVRHRSASVLVTLLQPLVDAEVATPPGGGAGETSATGGGPSPALGAASPSASSGLVLSADEATNRILASGDPRALRQLEEILERLDIQPPQVLLEVLIVSLNEGQTRDLGVELRGRIQNGTTQIALASLFGLGGPLATDVAVASPLGTGFTGAAVSPGDFSMLLRALATVTEGRSLNMPRLLVNNNEEGTFDAVLQQPFLATNASDTVATTSFGGTQDAGTSLSVKPQIADGDQIVLDYTVTLSEFLGESADPSLPPPRQQNSLDAVVTIPDGYTIILGGLEVETEGLASTEVPWLGELPLFGWLFSNESTSRSKTRFWVFLKANVVRHSRFEDLRFLSDADRREAGLPDDLPTVEPRVIR